MTRPHWTHALAVGSLIAAAVWLGICAVLAL